MPQQEKMSIADLARFLPREARFVARDHGVLGALGGSRWYAYSVKPKLSMGSGGWETGGRWWSLAINPDIDKPWDQSLTEIRAVERWRADKSKTYWVGSSQGEPYASRECKHPADDARYACGNYFRTKPEAQAYADACKALAMKMHEDAN